MPLTCSPGNASVCSWIFAVRAGPDDLGDRERRAEEEVAVANRERVAVERAHRRAGGAVALGVVLAAVARAAEAGERDGRDQRHVLVGDGVRVVERAVRLHRAAEMRAVVRDDREARLVVPELGRAVVADERRAARDGSLGLVGRERRDHALAFGEVRERPDVVILEALLQERRRDHEAEGGHRDETADDAAQTERRQFEELRARVALVGRGRRQLRLGGGRSGGALGLDLGCVGERAAGRQVAHPEQREHDRDDRADADDHPGDDHADEQHDHADGEPDGPDARAGNVRMVFVLSRQGGQSGFKRSETWLVNVVTARANSAGSGRLVSWEPSANRTQPTGGRPDRGFRRSSRSPAATRARPPQVTSRWHRCRSSRRRTAVSARGRGGRAGRRR